MMLLMMTTKLMMTHQCSLKSVNHIAIFPRLNAAAAADHRLLQNKEVSAIMPMSALFCRGADFNITAQFTNNPS